MFNFHIKTTYPYTCPVRIFSLKRDIFFNVFLPPQKRVGRPHLFFVRLKRRKTHSEDHLGRHSIDQRESTTFKTALKKKNQNNLTYPQKRVLIENWSH